MTISKPKPVNSIDNLRSRVNRLFKPVVKRPNIPSQQVLDFPFDQKPKNLVKYPSENISEFLSFIADSIPDGEVFLFGGVLRDLALLGRKGFHSDIDVVVEGEWSICVKYLESIGATKNKFGGFRLQVAGWPIDIWNAEDTWAIKQGFVKYKGIASLTDTTVLNWDAILMNWRTKSFICRENYLEELNARVLDVVLEKNPDPLGMAVRVFRHLCSKDAKKITSSALIYLADCTEIYSFDIIKSREIKSYGNTLIAPNVYKFFKYLKDKEKIDINDRVGIVSNILKKELGFA